MALFKKKLSLSEILEGIEGLSEEEKAQVTEKLSTPTEEKPVEPVGEKATDNVTEGEAVEEPIEESNEVEETTEEVVEETPIEEAVVEPTDEPVPQGQEMNELEGENQDNAVESLASRISAIEEQLNAFNELKSKMEEYTQKMADKFGYKGSVPGAKKDYKEMSADELSNELKTEI